MSAAPGGKSSYCAQLMKNTGERSIACYQTAHSTTSVLLPHTLGTHTNITGLLVANDLKPARQKATVGNLHRLGVRNALVVSYDGRKLPTVRRHDG